MQRLRMRMDVMNICVFCGDDELSYYVYEMEILQEETREIPLSNWYGVSRIPDQTAAINSSSGRQTRLVL